MATGTGQSAIELLEQDHREVERFFADYEDLKDGREKSLLAAKIFVALKVHTQIEEQIFYPEARKATGNDELIDEAVAEHGEAKALIAELEASTVGNDTFDRKMSALREKISHHVSEEEEKLFPEVEDAKPDLDAIGEQLAEKKAQLMSQLPRERLKVG
jgi:iron-sulfur cluster repair protein YtfE (RIC family)